MNKILLQHFQKIELLSTRNKSYQSLLDDLFLFFVKNDHVKEDITVEAFLPKSISSSKKTGVIVAKSSCVIAGIEEVEYLCKKHTKLTPKALISDGKKVEPGTKLLQFSGSAKDILAYERTFLNILQRMSGIATETSKYVAKVKNIRLTNPPTIAATRKTPWMHLDKKAVAIGGGVTHRLDLRDGILLKDNHLVLLSHDLSLGSEAEAISYAISNAKITDKNIAIEVEVKTDNAAYAAVAAWKKRKLQNPFIIMLDNFTPLRAGVIVEKIKKEEKNIFFEASGGITIDNVADFAKTGVDVISVGSLTHSSKAVDLSLDFL